ncbi:MAG: hypothetical protein VCF25_13640, partial [Candidatus Poribacteria bacterium]
HQCKCAYPTAAATHPYFYSERVTRWICGIYNIMLLSEKLLSENLGWFNSRVRSRYFENERQQHYTVG